MQVDVQKLRARLLTDVKQNDIRGISLAAVLVPLVSKDDQWSIVFTRRSDALARHSGEISFPGGKVDEGESSTRAAVRETHEELGVDPSSIDILGALPTAFTVVSGYQIAPWVGVIPGTDFSPSEAEIAEVLVIPIVDLVAEGVRREQRFIRGGGIYENPAYDVGDHIIWGATARILSEFLELIS